MKYAVIFAFLIFPGTSGAADAPASKPFCVRAQRNTDYNARPIGQHDIVVQNAVGDRRPLRVSTTCIHIYPDSFIALQSEFLCVGMGDSVSARTIDGHGERCRVSHVAPLVEGSIEAPYK